MNLVAAGGLGVCAPREQEQGIFSPAAVPAVVSGSWQPVALDAVSNVYGALHLVGGKVLLATPGLYVVEPSVLIDVGGAPTGGLVGVAFGGASPDGWYSDLLPYPAAAHYYLQGVGLMFSDGTALVDLQYYYAAGGAPVFIAGTPNVYIARLTDAQLV